MVRKKTFLALLFMWLLFGGCDQEDDFTPDQIADVKERESDINLTPFIPFSDTSVYLDGSVGNSVTFRARDIMGGAIVSSYSLSLWFKMDTQISTIQGSFVQTDLNPTEGFDLLWRKNTNILEFSHLYPSSHSSVVAATINNPSNWNHIIISYNHESGSVTNTIKMYVNGELVAEESLQSNQVIWRSSRMFAVLPVANLLSPCYVDEMAFWNRELTSAEVKLIYGRGAPGSLTVQVGGFDAWWRFGEVGTMPFVEDETGRYNLRFLGLPLSVDEFAIPLLDPFGDENYSDPLNDGESGDGTTGSGGGSDPLGGGNGGFGGELGDNGGSSGDLP